jgi:methyl-accepting chemotaxis protein
MHSGSAKVILAALLTIFITTGVALWIQKKSINAQGSELIKSTMRSSILQAEQTREMVSNLNKKQVFDNGKLLKELKDGTPLRSSSIYGTIPVVAAWNGVEEAAKKEGFDFRVPKERPRNPGNEPTAYEKQILDYFSKGNDEYYTVDRSAGKIIYARPIKLTEDCLTCHGDPATSPTRDGKDLAGGQMENWKAGEIHGAFVLTSSLDRIDDVVEAGLVRMLMWIVPLSAVMAVGFFYLYGNVIVGPLVRAVKDLDETSQNVANSSVEIAAASQSVAQGASTQAASLEETHAAIETLSAMIRRNAESAGSASKLAGVARNTSEKGNESMRRMQTAIQDIQKSASETATIVRAINDIAFQTNLLALNAAVEAARAGEAGKGFAVVAGEVRKLAKRSSDAANNTASLIDQSVKSAGAGTAIAQEVASALSEITGNSVQVDALVNEISTASLEQDLGVRQLTQSMAELEIVTQSNAAAAEQSASASQQLKSQADMLNACVANLGNLVKADESASRPA